MCAESMGMMRVSDVGLPELKAMLDLANAFQSDIDRLDCALTDCVELGWHIDALKDEIAKREGRYVYPDEEGNDGYRIEAT